MAADIVQEVKLRTDLVELISAYVPLRRAGRTHKGLCPFHSEKSPSFVVDGERGFFKCYGCGKGGDCFTFIQEKEGLSFPEAGELLARRLGLEWVRQGETSERRGDRERLHDVCALATRFFRQCLERDAAALEYLEHRGIAADTLEQFQLGYAPPTYEALLRWLRTQGVALEDAEAADLVLRSESGLRDRFVARIIFPIFDIEGRPIAFGGRTMRPDGIPKYLNSKETAIFTKGRTLYGLHAARPSITAAGHAVVVEGYMDLIALHQAGVAESVATLGTALTEQHIALIKRFTQDLVLCFDGDSAGIRAAERSAPMFEQAGCTVRVVSLPGGADPDTFIRNHGLEAFRAAVTRAEPLIDFLIRAARGRHHTQTSEGRLAFVREATRLVAQSSSHLTRQEHTTRLERVIGGLADEWYPGDPRSALQARDALIQEVRRLLHSGGPRSTFQHSFQETRKEFRERPSNWLGQSAPSRVRYSGVRSAPMLVNAGTRFGAERYVLRAALSEPEWAARLASAATRDHFSDPALQVLAAAFFEDPGEGSAASERAARILRDPAMAEQVSAVLMVDAPLSEEGFERCLTALDRDWKQRRLAALQARSVSEGLGEREAIEIRELLSELGGRQRRED